MESLRSQKHLRNRILILEAIELAILSICLWSLLVLNPGNRSHSTFPGLFIFLLVMEGMVLGSWAVYNIYIRIARVAGQRVDIAIWMIASAFTGSLTFWTWTILDINRLLVTRLFYQGEAPVEYAWSSQSKQARKVWEQTQRASGT